jgi:hypothetical protein
MYSKLIFSDRLLLVLLNNHTEEFEKFIREMWEENVTYDQRTSNFSGELEYMRKDAGRFYKDLGFQAFEANVLDLYMKNRKK